VVDHPSASQFDEPSNISEQIILDPSSHMLKSGDNQNRMLPMAKPRTLSKRKRADMTPPVKRRKTSHEDILGSPSPKVDESANVMKEDVCDSPSSEFIQQMIQRNISSESPPMDIPVPLDFNRVKHSAEFFSCLELHEESFLLYELIWKQVKDCQIPSVRIQEMIAYACSATTSVQVETVTSLMEHEMRQTRAADPENFLYPMVIIDALSRSPQHATASTMSFSLPKNLCTILPDLQNRDQCFGLLLCRYACRTLNSGSHNTDPTELQDHILHDIPGPFELENGMMKNQCLRVCLSWCDRQLGIVQLTKLDRLFGFEDVDYDHDHVHSEIENALFCLFWSRWVEENKSPQQQVMMQVERLMGVSAIHVLRILSELIANTFPHRPNKSTVITGPHQAPLIQRARKGSMELLQLPDERLAKRFLEKFIQNQSLPHPGEQFQAERMKMPLRLRARTLVQRYLDNSSPLENRIQGHDPPLAPSPSSSDLSAFANLNRRSQIKETKPQGDLDNRKSSSESMRSQYSLFDETKSAMLSGRWK
jgi:hypothetical protein